MNLQIWEYGIAIGVLALFFIPITIWVIKRAINAAFDSNTLRTELAAHRIQVLDKLALIEISLKNRESTCGADHQLLTDAVHAATVTLKESITLQTFIIEHYIKINGVK